MKLHSAIIYLFYSTVEFDSNTDTFFFNTACDFTA